jgi:hypothetical protein
VPELVRGLGRAKAWARRFQLCQKTFAVGELANHPFSPGITNHDEYSLVRELMEEKKDEGTGTLRKDKTLLRDEKKMEKLKQKLHTDDECEQ